MLKDRHTIPVMVNCYMKNKSSFKTCLGCIFSQASCSDNCFSRANFEIRRKETIDVSYTVLNFLSGRVAVDRFQISRSQRVECQHFERNFSRQEGQQY